MSNPNYPNRSGYSNPARPPVTASQPRPVYRYTQQFLREEANKLILATWGPRLVALLIDFTLVAVSFFIVSFGVNFVFGILFPVKVESLNGETLVTDNNNPLSFLPGETGYFLWSLFYGFYGLAITRLMGATVGKRIMNLKVVKINGSRPDSLQLLLRYFLVCYALLSTIVLVWSLSLAFRLDILLGTRLLLLPGLVLGIGLLWAGFDAKKQAFHDKIFLTLVVIANPMRI